MPVTYDSLSTFTTTNASSSSYTISPISTSYTDLVLVMSLKSNASNSSLVARFNSDSGSNYSNTYLSGNGTSSLSNRFSNQTSVYLNYLGFPNAASTFSAQVIHVMNYSSTNMYKTFLSRSDSSLGSDSVVGLWRSTSQITSITLYAGDVFATDCTFSLYGIAKA